MSREAEPGVEPERWLVVGLGNPLRGDDGLGARVVELLAGAGVDTWAEHGPTPELAERVARYSRVVFVDAAIDDSSGARELRGSREGKGADDPDEDIVLHPVITLGPAPTGLLGHALDVPTVITLARALFGFRGDAFVCALRAERFDEPFALTPAAEARAQRAAARLRTLAQTPA